MPRDRGHKGDAGQRLATGSTHKVDDHFEQEARKVYGGPPSCLQGPKGRGSIWIFNQNDITAEFLGTFHIKPMIVTCKEGRVESVDKAA